MTWSGKSWLKQNGWSDALAGATTTWNPADKNANIALSSGNLTATEASNAATFDAFRGISNRTTGKVFWENLIVSPGGGGFNIGVGIANAAMSLNGSYIGGNNDSVGWGQGANTIIRNGGFLSSMNGVTFGNGDVIGIAADLTAKLIWFRKNGGDWMGDATANPATGAGGADFSPINAGPYYPAGHLLPQNDAMTANFGASAFSFTAPSGFGNW